MRSKGQALVQVDHFSISGEIGARIRENREDKRISQQELGKMLGISLQQVKKYESGANNITISRLLQICLALGLTIDNLISGIILSKDRQYTLSKKTGLSANILSDPRFDSNRHLKMKDVPNWPRGMNDRVAASYTGIKLAKFRTLVIRGLAPAPIDLGLGSEVWFREHLDAWLDKMFA